MMQRSLLLLGFIAGLLALAPVAAQVMYKSTLPDGRVVYGDKPDPAAAKVEQFIPDTPSQGLGGSTPREAEAVQEMGKARGERESADARVQAAHKALEAAQAARAAGIEPLPGERIGTAGGGSRLNESYDLRQRQLNEAVEKARRDLEQARSGK